MKLYINKNTGAVTTSVTSNTAIERIEVTRLNTVPFECFFHDGENGVALADGSAGLLVVKKSNDPNGTAILYVPAWTPPPTTLNGYLFSLLVASAALNTALGNLPDTTLELQVIWTENGRRMSTPPIDIVVNQTYWQGTEEVPQPDPPFPLPGAILTTDGNLAGLNDVGTARANLGLATMGFRAQVGLPASFTAEGAVGDWALDAASGRLWFYIGDGETTHAWAYTQLILA
jgi:hypothetical protein